MTIRFRRGAMVVVHDPSLKLKAKLFRGLADPSRLAIVEALRGGEQTVSDVVAATGLMQPNVSGHLACLRDCGLVAGRQDGRYVYYGLAGARIERLLRAAEAVLADVGGEIYACTRYEAEGTADEPGDR